MAPLERSRACGEYRAGIGLLVKMTAAAKILLISILIMSIIIPARAAAAADPRRGLRSALVQMVLFNLFYVLAITYLYPRLL